MLLHHIYLHTTLRAGTSRIILVGRSPVLLAYYTSLKGGVVKSSTFHFALLAPAW